MELAAERHDVVRPKSESDVMEYILSKEGVLRVEPLDRRTVGRLVEAEESITRVSGGMRLENRGMTDCAGMERNFVMFCDASFPRPDEVTMEMVDDRGVVIGHDVPPCMRQDFAARDDIIWMADGFVMYPRRVGEHDVRMVMLSSRFDVPEPLVSRIFYPSLTTAHMLNGMFGVECERLASVVIGVNGLDAVQFL